ncbi:uncharacterized protein LOC112563545 isoform X6 [Pomacea canaliculata]|uniref:uncharacterized protein LOC112563545 isoform X6 n=1 Tax=Pomacea canaliculata TaxID=400727 RepID=UPI000D732961|nr:uncharacterized protein LOC112563545 isoform X6 [Pomacea canaliculata]
MDKKTCRTKVKEKQKIEKTEESLEKNTLDSSKNFSKFRDKERTLPIKAKVVQNSRTVVSLKEAERLSKDASKIFSELPLDKLQVIHRYRPESTNIPPIVENGHVQNYTCHVGSALHAKNYVDFYMKEGLQTGKGEYSKRLQRLKSSKKKADIAQRDKGNSQNKAREDNYSLFFRYICAASELNK